VNNPFVLTTGSSVIARIGAQRPTTNVELCKRWAFIKIKSFRYASI
jgi:hypothetical protein